MKVAPGSGRNLGRELIHVQRTQQVSGVLEEEGEGLHHVAVVVDRLAERFHT